MRWRTPGFFAAILVTLLFVCANMTTQSQQGRGNMLRWSKAWMIERTYGWPWISYYQGNTVLGAPKFYAGPLAGDLALMTICAGCAGFACSRFLRRSDARRAAADAPPTFPYPSKRV